MIITIILSNSRQKMVRNIIHKILEMVQKWVYQLVKISTLIPSRLLEYRWIGLVLEAMEFIIRTLIIICGKVKRNLILKDLLDHLKCNTV